MKPRENSLQTIAMVAALIACEGGANIVRAASTDVTYKAVLLPLNAKTAGSDATEAVAGTTVVPFGADPIGMSAVNDTFPPAGPDGSYSYEKTVSLKALESAFTTKFPGQKLDLDWRVVFLHGVPASTTLPATAASLDHLPAQMLLPIACGEIKKLAE